MRFQAMQEYAEQMVREYPVPGLVLALSEKGETVYEFSHGFRHVEKGLPATTASRFGVGSITKSFTAIALLQLQERGKLAVTDLATRYLPRLRFPGAEQVTLHHLLTHSAGLPMLGTENYTDIDEAAPALPPLGKNGRTRITDLDELIEALAEIEFTPVAPPGAVMSYSNDGWSLLGAVVERVSETPYIEYVTRQILRPLGMDQTVFGTFDAAGGGTSRYAPGPEGGFEAKGGSIWRTAAVAAGGGPMLSTCQDLLRYADFYRSEGQGVLTPASLRQMTTPYLPVTPTSSYGYGISIQQLAGVGTLVGHGGGDLGVSAYFGTVPERGLSVAVQSNIGTALVYRLSEGALRAAAGAAPEAGDPPVVACGAEVLERFVGTFEADQVKACHRIYLEGGELMVETGGQSRKAVYVGDDTIFVPGTPETARSFTLAKDAGGVCHGIRSGSRVFVPAGMPGSSAH